LLLIVQMLHTGQLLTDRYSL